MRGSHTEKGYQTTERETGKDEEGGRGEKERARQAARERVILEFEKGQLGLAAVSTTGTTSAGESKEDGESLVVSCCHSGPTTMRLGRGTKRKFAFDSSKVENLAQEAEEAALQQIEREQAAALRNKLPDFWLPSLTPTYSSVGPPQTIKT